jgi:zinc protease
MTRKAKVLAVFVIPLLVTVSGLRSQEGNPGWSGPPAQYRLTNGLTVILYNEPSLPLVSVVVAYRAGTMVEGPDQAGMAFLLQNLMFQGSENVGPKQHVNFVQKAGGELNAQTTFDRTVFYQTLPSNQLALALWLESDRMRSLALIPGEVERVRNDILAAHRDRIEVEPYFESFEAFNEILFNDQNGIYGHPLIGTGEDLLRLTREDALAFRAKYYSPTNAVLCIVGKIDFSRTRELVARFFGSLPPGKEIPPPSEPVFDQTVEREATRTEGAGRLPGFHLGYRFYPLQTDDRYSLRILEYILLRGRTSRLFTRLMKKDRTAHDLIGDLERRNNVLGLKIFVVGSNALNLGRAKRAILAEIEKIKMSTVSEEEMEKAKNLFKLDYFLTLSTTLGRALYLVDGWFSGISPESVPYELGRYLRTISPVIRSLAQRHFRDSNRVVLDLVRK